MRRSSKHHEGNRVLRQSFSDAFRSLGMFHCPEGESVVADEFVLDEPDVGL